MFSFLKRKVPKISVIIATKNEEKDVPFLLKSLRDQTLNKDEFEVIFVDGRSTDRTQKIIKDYKHSHWKLIIEDKPKSPARARNLAVKKAGAPILRFLDGDNILSRNELALILKRFEDFDIDALCTNTIAFEPNLIGELYEVERRIWFNPRKAMPNAYKKQVYEALNGFDEDMGFGEDRDIARRFDEHGFRKKYFPEIVVYHREPQDLESVKNQLLWYGRTLPAYWRKNKARGTLLLGAIAFRAFYPLTLLSYFFNPFWFALSCGLVAFIIPYQMIRALFKTRKIKTVL
ncbi:MAG: glycosyltransferase, partial [Nanoarchaeota archaeon]|nr:glycosyltransferase [Nanoarchaeota archaeon]